MSIATLARSRAARTAPPPPQPPPGAMGELAPPEDDESKKTISDALTAIAAYIPSEVIAVYTLVIAMTVTSATTAADGKTVQAMLPMWAFYAFLVAIPLMVWLLYAVNKVEAKEPIPWSPKDWPFWEAASSMIAFAAWSAAMPKSAFLKWPEFTPAMASILLVIVSIVLPLVGVLVTKKPAGTES